jgi:hypothetical protein
MRYVAKIYNGYSLDTSVLVNTIDADSGVTLDDLWNWCILDHLPNSLNLPNIGSTLSFIGRDKDYNEIWKVNSYYKDYNYFLVVSND